MRKRNLAALSLFFLQSLTILPLHAQPLLTKIVANDMHAGEREIVVLLGSSFEGIRIKKAWIGDFSTALLSADVVSDNEIRIEIRVPYNIDPGRYPFSVDYDGDWTGRMSSELNKEPELELLLDGAPVINGQSQPVAFPPATEGKTVTREFVLSNTGGSALQLRSLQLPPGFALDGLFPETVEPNSGFVFSIQLQADTVGSFAGTVQFSNNDGDENPFSFPVSGQVDAARTEIATVDSDQAPTLLPEPVASLEPVSEPEVTGTPEPITENEMTPESNVILPVDASKTGTTTIIVLAILGVAAVLGVTTAVLVFGKGKPLSKLKHLRRTSYKFRTGQDLGKQTIKAQESGLVKSDLELRLKPVFDLGNVGLKHKTGQFIIKKDQERQGYGK